MYQDKPQKTQSDSNKLSRYFHHIPGKTSSGENITTSSSLKFNKTTSTRKKEAFANSHEEKSSKQVEKNIDLDFEEDVDPYVGSAPVHLERRKVYLRAKHASTNLVEDVKLKAQIKTALKEDHHAARQAARYELLLTEEPGFMETEDGEESWKITQNEISLASDIATANKKFELRLDQFGPYRLDYSTNGRHLLLGGHIGHIAAFDWSSKDLMCEINVMETLNDIKWLHTENLFAVAQKKWSYVYDNQGVEIHCLKMLNSVLRMDFLPYHFLLVSSTSHGFLHYLDISVGQVVSTIKTHKGRLDVLTHNPSNGVALLGHHSGTVTMYAPNQPEALATILCHKSPVRAVAVDKQGNYMATSGQDRRIRIFDLRTYKPLHAYKVHGGASNLHFSQRGLLAASCQQVVEIYKDPCVEVQEKPYLTHHLHQAAQDLMFCPYEDILGVGCENGFTSMLVPGAGEPNYDAFECNPYRSKKQRQEWEMKALLEKIPPDLISLDPTLLSQVDQVTMEQLEKDKEERLGYKQGPKKFVPRVKQKGKSKSSNVERRKALVRATLDREKLSEAKNRKLEESVKPTKVKKKIVKDSKLKSSRIENNEKVFDNKIPEQKSVLNRFLKTS